ncbi:CD226 antigen [Galemys pyrenaicus]|uniref:CD226 antigen n=1 Tax=Galemys pyrenaicus TaxID=202257 RepID=A0A8J6AHM9_GALPY|nr:CD226 antigen [Galemys pyrenaicus]
MEWFKINATQKKSIAIFHPSLGISIREPYYGRVHFLNSNMTNDMTLSFLNASEADEGFYSCFLHTFPRGTWEKVIQVVSSGVTELQHNLCRWVRVAVREQELLAKCLFMKDMVCPQARIAVVGNHL